MKITIRIKQRADKSQNDNASESYDFKLEVLF